MRSVRSSKGFDGRDGMSIAVGFATLAVLLLLPRVTRKVPAVLVAVVGATIVTAVFDLDVNTVGALPQGLPKPDLPWTNLDDVVPLLVAAVGITLVSLTDTIATSTSFAARRGDEVDPNQEMIGIGTANLAAGVFQGFAVSTSGSRTAVAEQSGAKSQLTGLVGATCVALMLLFFSSLLADLPQAALAAVVISAALVAGRRRLRQPLRPCAQELARALDRRLRPVSCSSVCSPGILLAIVLSILLFFHRSWWPNGEILGWVERDEEWHALSSAPEAVEPEGVLVYRWEAPLFFANAGMFRQQIRHHVRRRRPQWVVLQCEAITDIDVTAADMLERLDTELNAMGVHMAFVELGRGCTTSCTATGSSRRSTAITSTTRSTRRWMPSGETVTTPPEAARSRDHRERRRSAGSSVPRSGGDVGAGHVPASTVASPIVAPTTDPTMTSPG